MFSYLSKQPKPLLFIYGLVLAGLVSLSGYYSEPGAFLFYVLPVSLATWFAGRSAGIALSLICAMGWFAAEWAGNMLGPDLAPLWNGLMRCGVFLVLTFVVAAFAEATQEKDELIQFVVHDLRSPLTSLLAGLQTLQMLDEAPEEEKREMVEIALISGERMLTLVNSLLDMPRMASGQMPLQCQDVHVQELLYAAVQQVSLWARQSEVSLQFDFAEDIPDVQVDPQITERVLVNLLGNALKFSPAGSTVTIRAFPSDRGMVTLSVSDQGPGIAAEWKNKIFGKYTQIRDRKPASGQGPKKKIASTGLGLTFCDLAVKAQGGQIWLESEVGKGTTFSFTVKAVARPAPETSQLTAVVSRQ